MMTFIALLSLLAAQDQKHKIEAAPKAVEAREKDPAGFVCEGTTTLPEGCRLDIYTYFGKTDAGAHVNQSPVIVKNGAFAASFTLLPRKNLAGEYTFRIVFDPNLQAARFQNLAPLEISPVLKVGTDKDAAGDRQAAGEKLVGEARKLIAIAEEAREKMVKDNGKPDPAAWARLLKDWERRAGEINHHLLDHPEFKILHFEAIVNSGFEFLTGCVMDIARCASRGEKKNIQEGRVHADLFVSKLENQLTGRPLDPRMARIDLAMTARTCAEMAVKGSDEGFKLAKNRFTQVMLDLSNPRLETPDEIRKTLTDIRAEANVVFDAVEQKKDAKSLFEKLDARLLELHQALQELK